LKCCTGPFKTVVGELDPGQCSVADSCEQGNDHAASIKGGEFLDDLSNNQLLKKVCVAWS